MGFPTWTLWGMGLSALGALLAVGLAFLAQSPRMLTRLNLTRQRLDLRARAFTGYGLALLLLGMGFFLAGVPLGPEAGAAVDGDEATLSPDEAAAVGTSAAPTVEGTRPNGIGGGSGAMTGLATPGSSGAMDGLGPALDAGGIISGTAEIALPPGATTGEPPAATDVPAEATATPEPTATRAPTETPTPTASPTPTATPILVPTARIGDGTSTLPVRQLPAGPVLVVLVRGDTVIPLPGHAFHTGDLWREISTVNGVIGWVPDQFLDYGVGEVTSGE